MDANTFLNATNFTIAEEVKLEPLDPKKVEIVSEINVDTIEFVQSETLDGLFNASATADSSIDPDYASYQPLNEAGLMTAGNSVSQSAMGSNTNNSLGIQSRSLDNLDTAGQVVPPIEGVEEQPDLLKNTKENILEAQTTISSALVGVANNADKAEGAQKITSPTQLEIGGNAVYFVSETMIHTTTPVMSTTAEVITAQAKTYQITADLVTESLKNKYSNVEETVTDIAGNRITTTLGREIKVASDVNQTALANYTINADIMETYSQSLIELRSVKSTRITADENIVNQAGNISITASPGSKKNNGKLESPGDTGETINNEDGTKTFTATNAAGQKVKFDNVKTDGPKWKNSGAQLEGVAENKNPAKASSGKGNITILADGKNDGGTLTIVNQSQVTSSKKDQTNLAKNINNVADNSIKSTGKKLSMEATTLASVSSSKNIQFSTSSSMTLMTGGQTFQGLRSSDVGKMTKLADIGGPLELKEIPKLPKLPSGISAEGLEKCIQKGKKGGLQREVEDFTDDVEEGAEAIIAAGRTLLGLDSEEDDPNFDNIKLNKKPKKNQKVEAPSVEEAGRIEKAHPKPTGKDVVNVGGTLEDSNSDPGSVKLSKMGPLGETTSPSGQASPAAENEVIGSAGVIEGGSDIFLPDEDNSEDIIDVNKPEDVQNTGDGAIEDEIETQPTSEVSKLVIGIIDELTEDTYKQLAIKFTTETEGYHIVEDETLPIKGKLIFAEDYYDVIIKYLKRKYTEQPYPEQLEWVDDEEERFKEYYNFIEGFIDTPNLQGSDREFFFKGVGREWVDYLEEQVLSGAAIGGVFGFIKGAKKFIKNNINISDNIDDLKSGDRKRVLKGLGNSLPPSLGGDYFKDASTIIKQSKFLQQVYTNVSGTFDPYVRDKDGNIKKDDNGNPILNPNNNTAGFVDALDLAGMQRLLTDATKIIGVENITISQNLITGLTAIKNLDVFQREGYTPEIELEVIKVIKNSTGVTQKKAEDFYYSTRDRLKLVVEGDLKSAVTNLALDEVLSAVLGPANTQAIKDLSKLYTGTKKLILKGINKTKKAYNTANNIYNSATDAIDTGKDLYTAIKAAPAVMSMMNYYEVPTLNQVNTLLTCLDIKNNVKDILQNVKDISKSVDKLEELGGDLFNILGNTIDNIGEAKDIITERVDSLLGDGPQLTPRVINPTTNTNLLSQQDVMSDLTQGLVSGGIVSNPRNSVSIPSTYINNVSNTGNTSEPPQITGSEENTANTDTEQEGSTNQLTNAEEELKDAYLNSKKSDTFSFEEPVCPEPYNAFADSNESNNPADWQEKVSDEELFKYIETLPRLGQMYNSILELPPGEQVDGLTQEQIIDIKNTKVNIKLDPCFSQVKLNSVEANIQVLELKEGMMLFKLQQKELLTINNKDSLPGVNTLIQIYVEQFYDTSKERALQVERTTNFYTPIIYNFKVSSFKIEENIGLAQLIPTQSRIYLRSANNNLVYNYNIFDIGNKLVPQILDSYIVL